MVNWSPVYIPLPTPRAELDTSSYILPVGHGSVSTNRRPSDRVTEGTFHAARYTSSGTVRTERRRRSAASPSTHDRGSVLIDRLARTFR
jgi:hypothetical protein